MRQHGRTTGKSLLPLLQEKQNKTKQKKTPISTTAPEQQYHHQQQKNSSNNRKNNTNQNYIDGVKNNTKKKEKKIRISEILYSFLSKVLKQLFFFKFVSLTHLYVLRMCARVCIKNSTKYLCSDFVSYSFELHFVSVQRLILILLNFFHFFNKKPTYFYNKLKV